MGPLRCFSGGGGLADRVGELLEHASADVACQRSAELGDAAGQVHGRVGAEFRPRCGRARPQRDVGLGLRPSGVLPLRQHADRPGFPVLFEHPGDPVERELDGSDRDSRASGVELVAEFLGELRAGKASRQHVHVVEHPPHLIERQLQGGVHLHRDRRISLGEHDLHVPGRFARRFCVLLGDRGRLAAGAADQRPPGAVARLGDSLRVRGAGFGDGGHDVPVAGAAADHAGQLRGELLVGDLGFVAEQVVGAEQETRGAETALQGVVPPEGLLQRVQVVRTPEPFDGDDLGAVELAGEQQAGADCFAVDQHGAHPADPVLAADVGSGQSQVVAQRVRQRDAGGEVQHRGCAVDREPHFDGFAGFGADRSKAFLHGFSCARHASTSAVPRTARRYALAVSRGASARRRRRR